MNGIVSIDEAMEILQKLKEHGEENVLMSELDISTGITNAATLVSINHGILVVKKSNNPISYVENCIMGSLKTQTNVSKLKTIMFAKV